MVTSELVKIWRKTSISWQFSGNLIKAQKSLCWIQSIHSFLEQKITEQQGKEKFDIEGGVVLMTSKYLVKKVNRKKSADRNKIERFGNW